MLLTLQGWLRRWDADGRVHFKRWFDPEVLKSINIVVFSEEDITESPQMEQEFAANVEHLIVTRAERGGTYYHFGEAFDYARHRCELVEATGAGDVFASSLLASLPALDHDFRAALQVAAQLGAGAVTRPMLDGAPTPEEAQAALKAASTAKAGINPFLISLVGAGLQTRGLKLIAHTCFASFEIPNPCPQL